MRPPPDQAPKKKSPIATGSRGDSGSGLDKPTVSQTRDTKSNADLRRGNKFKQTAPYRGAVRAAYTVRPTSQRARSAQDALGRRSVEAQVVAKTHADRTRGNQVLLASRLSTGSRGAGYGALEPE